MNELVTRSTELASDIGFTDEVSWTPPENLTLDQYLAIGRTFQQIKESLAFWYGDLLVHGEAKFGDAFAQVADDSGKALETLIKYKSVADRVPREIRQPGIGWTSHFYVAYSSKHLRGPMLLLSANLGLSSRELKEVTKLADNLIEDLIAAAKEGIDKESFLNLVNKFKLGAIDKPKPKDDDDEEEEELPFSDLDNDDEEEDMPSTQMGLSIEDVYDFWENAGTALTSCGPNHAIWNGLSVQAALDDSGRSVLVWEQIP